jgi:U3 small nucleolar RNA-associated protein 20
MTSHVHKTEPLEPVAEVLLKIITDELKLQSDKSEKDWNRLVVVLKVVSSVVGVRNGSRTPRESPSLLQLVIARYNAHEFLSAASTKPKFFALLTSLTPLLQCKPPATFLHHLLTFLASLLPQAVLSDILSSPVRTMLEAFFSPEASDAVFAAGCTLASVLDQSDWNLFETALGKLVLESTGRNLATASGEKDTEVEAEFGQVDKKKNSLALLGKLTKSERLRKLVQKGGQAAAVWERNVAQVCEDVIKRWKAAFEQDQDVEEEQVSRFTQS